MKREHASPAASRETAEGTKSSAPSSRIGIIAAFATYGMWGLFPLYWKRLEAIDPFQILCHRIVWAALFTVLLLGVQGRLSTLFALYRNRRQAAIAVASGAFITANWGIYIWAVNTAHVTESSLGYFINPLLSVLLGAIVFQERMDRWTVAAVVIATAGVGAASIMLGSPPWISLGIASTFALYGAVKKKAGFDPITGLAAETLAACPVALAFLASRHVRGFAILGGQDHVATVMLIMAGIVTAVPLITFNFAANRITLQQMGFIQYVSPTSQLALGLFVYGENLTSPLLVAFATVIVAVLVYASTRGRARAAQAR